MAQYAKFPPHEVLKVKGFSVSVVSLDELPEFPPQPTLDGEHVPGFEPEDPETFDPYEVSSEEALAMLGCAYYQGVGICSGGCHEEPRCQVDEPMEGWVAYVRV